MRGKTHIAVHLRPVLGREAPGFHFPEFGVAEPLLQRIVDQGTLAALQIQQIRHAVAGEASSPEGDIPGFIFTDAEAPHRLYGISLVKHFYLTGRWIQLIKIPVEAPLTLEVNHIIGGVPQWRSVDGGIEILGHRRHLSCFQIHYEALDIEIVGHRLGSVIGADTFESFRTAEHEQFFRIRRIYRVVDITVHVFQYCIGGEGGHIHLHQRNLIKGIM